MTQGIKRIISVVFAILLCSLLGFSSLAATANEYGLGLTTGQKNDKYTVTLKNENGFPVSGVQLICELPGELRSSAKTDAEASELMDKEQ